MTGRRTVFTQTLLLLCLTLLLLSSAAWGGQAANRKSAWFTGRKVFIQHCAVCHRLNSGTRAPLPSALRQMPAEAILQALRNGVMKQQGSALTADEQEAVARYLGRRGAPPARITTGFCSPGSSPQLQGDPAWAGWGNGITNARFQAGDPGETGADRDWVSRLRLKWAFGFPVPSTVQPVVFGGRVLTGSADGSIYSLDARTGCIYWIFKASSEIRSSISVSPDGRRAFAADSQANVYSINAATGALIWKAHIDPHPLAIITGSPLLYDGRLYVPVSSSEEGAAVNPYYPCCTFRGSLVALDAATGKQIWKTYTVQKTPALTGKNLLGIPTYGPSGAAIWSSPTIDLKRKAIYVATGNNYSHPSGIHSDAVLAFAIETGRIIWSRQVTPNDTWTVACISGDKTNCPHDAGDDYDFGSPPILVKLAGGRNLILAAQKSGMIYAIDPDHERKIVWETRIAKGGAIGGVEWGGAAGDGKAYFPVSDWVQSVPLAGGGLAALRIATGAELWHAKPIRPACLKTPGCSAAQVAPVTAIPGVVFSGSMDGYLRAYDARNGHIFWDADTARAFKTTDGIPAHGGSMNKNGAAVAGGMIFVESGSPQGMPGNVLLAFSVDGK
ncbi:MAG: PQQ-binding-like beta-propeller repeat protein [Acidobacteriota bacterium]|nr:PQQ-binding-like beta-propeller repeat protein [Acidobacteriota bacterium]